jgi:hypothetical protein
LYIKHWKAIIFGIGKGVVSLCLFSVDLQTKVFIGDFKQEEKDLGKEETLLREQY